ncbi:TonB-dependent receptor [Psychrosphaera sp. B3R10]|uniref:TonB-dependent receptor n=1 Tax=unclassified Psychrosphaera TaxID=2641570 RepID=UPI001C087491|nr:MULTISPECIES: TonB-dependent receptor [unclassified Psychrosphaera]MBU2883468.1 TonB-dependent receptor [Psychrosphaera sp. I2R16]MBU2990324.1 TonB-dependent receptor [Psychrosphaera sp. B3R10]
MNNNYRLSLLAASVSFSISTPALAQGQETSAEQDIEKITVTARGRVETIQSVPDSITAISGNTIENANIKNFSDIANLTPNLGQLDNFRPGLSRITIRGLVTPQVGDPPIAYVVDGITASDIEFINQEMVDIERIEVMRGAQGALYGRGAVGGAILITTKDGYDELEGNVKASIGNAGSYHLGTTISGGLTKDTDGYFRVGAYTKGTDGQIKNTFLNKESDFLEETGVFGKVQFEGLYGSEISLQGRYTTTEAGFAYYQNVSEHNKEDFDIETSQNVNNIDERDVTEFSAKLNKEFELGTFEIIAAYNSSDDEHFYDGDYSADPTYIDEPDWFRAPFATGGHFKVESTTLESRFTSNNDKQLRWSVAAFYQDRERDNTVNFYDDFEGDVSLFAADFPADQIYLTIADINSSKAYGIAGQINYDITDKLELTGALRFDQDDRQSYDPNYQADTFAEKNFAQWQPKITIGYQLQKDVLIYTGYSKGFRSGGFNEPAEGISRTFDKEVSDSYEAGFKSTIFDGLTINGAAFFIAQSDAQITQFNVDTFTLENLGIDTVETSGFEFELGYKVSQNLNLRASLGKVNSEIVEFSDRPELEGYSQVYVADYNFSFSADYETELNANWQLFAHGNFYGEGPKSFDIEMPDVTSSSDQFFNASIGIRSDSWTIKLAAKNLTDERTIEDIFLFADGVTDLARQPNKPRSIVMEASYSF